jgi:hypothetical protein
MPGKIQLLRHCDKRACPSSFVEPCHSRYLPPGSCPPFEQQGTHPEELAIDLEMLEELESHMGFLGRPLGVVARHTAHIAVLHIAAVVADAEAVDVEGLEGRSSGQRGH